MKAYYTFLVLIIAGFIIFLIWHSRKVKQPKTFSINWGEDDTYSVTVLRKETVAVEKKKDGTIKIHFRNGNCLEIEGGVKEDYETLIDTVFGEH